MLTATSTANTSTDGSTEGIPAAGPAATDTGAFTDTDANMMTEMEDGLAPDTEDALLVLDQTIVKASLTLLHREVDAVIADLATRTGNGIAGIPEEMNGRLAKITSDHKELLASARQRAMFTDAAAPLLASARERSEELRLRRIHTYQADVVERQNAALASRATADENVFDDALQTRCRDVILFNLDSLHAALPQAERADKRDAACRDLYRAILDRRLALRPETAANMLRSAAIRRVLGNAEAREYDRTAAAAIAARRLVLTARDWIAAGVPPGEAEARAKERGDAGSAILAEYRRLRTDEDERSALAHLLPVRDAWSAVAAAKYRLDASVAGAASPALAALVRDLLDEWLTNGGRPPEPDYCAFLRYMALPRSQIWAELADETRAHALVRSLGGPDGPAFAVVARRLSAASTPEDAALAADLAMARDEYVRVRWRDARQLEAEPAGTSPTREDSGTADSGTVDNGAAQDGRKESSRAQDGRKEKSAQLNRFLSAVHRDRRVRLERSGGASGQPANRELLAGELAEIIQSCMASCMASCSQSCAADRAGEANSKTPLAIAG